MSFIIVCLVLGAIGTVVFFGVKIADKKKSTHQKH